MSRVPLIQIIHAACEEMGVPVIEFLGRGERYDAVMARRCVKLIAHQEGWSNLEIAEGLGLGLGNTARAVRRLRRSYEQARDGKMTAHRARFGGAVHRIRHRLMVRRDEVRHSVLCANCRGTGCEDCGGVGLMWSKMTRSGPLSGGNEVSGIRGPAAENKASAGRAGP